MPRCGRYSMLEQTVVLHTHILRTGGGKQREVTLLIAILLLLLRLLLLLLCLSLLLQLERSNCSLVLIQQPSISTRCSRLCNLKQLRPPHRPIDQVKGRSIGCEK